MIDEFYRWAIIFSAWMIGGFLGTAGVGLSLIITFFTYWLYGVGFEVLNNGVTPGKRSLNLRVVHNDGTPIRLPASLVRNFLLTIDFLPMLYAAGIVSLLITKPFQRIGDLAAGTMVVHDVNLAVDDSITTELAKPTPVVLMQEEQTVLVDFLERAPQLNAARADELALILAESLQAGPDDVRGDIEKIAAGFKGAAREEQR